MAHACDLDQIISDKIGPNICTTARPPAKQDVMMRTTWACLHVSPEGAFRGIHLHE
jgi:hypothetical protein